MFNKFRYWLSAELISWGVKVLPDEYSKGWMGYGIYVATEGMLEGLMDESEE